jgi:hypothetical protein
MLLAIAFMGTGAAIGNIRFTDSIRSAQSYFQQQYDNTVNGVNVRSGAEACSNSTVGPGADPAGRSNCLLLGKILVFPSGQNAISEYYVVGSEPASIPQGLNTDQLLAAYKPQVVTTAGAAAYTIPWGANVISTKRIADNTAIDSYLLLRSPTSAEVKTYTFNSNNLSGTVISNYFSLTNPLNATSAANICIQSSDISSKVAAISVGGVSTSGQAGITAVFDTTRAASCL